MDLTQHHLLEEGERMLEKVRKHWLVYVYDIVIHAVGCLVFILAAFYLAVNNKLWFKEAFYGDYGAMILIAFVILFWTSFFFAWTKTYFDVWYVTDQHIIAIEQDDLFDRDEAFMELTRIQDVFFQKVGILQTFFGYGELKVQSAGTEQEFIIENVADVEGCAHRIMALRDEAQSRGNVLGAAV